jgi:putative alpha-1,2-mannosidase
LIFLLSFAKVAKPEFYKVYLKARIHWQRWPGYQVNKFKLKAKNNSKENIYIHSLELNDNKYSEQVLKHRDLIKGGKLTFNLSSTH